MKFICLAGEGKAQETIKREYKGAERFGEVRLGESVLFYRYFIRIKYVPYGEVTGAYLRQESGESGEFLLVENYLMLETKEGVVHKLRMEREAYAREVLSVLRKRYQFMRIGYTRPGQSK